MLTTSRWDNAIWKAGRAAQEKAQKNMGLEGLRKPNIEQRKHIFEIAREQLGLKESDELEEIEVDADKPIS